MLGKLYIVATPIGNLRDITLRAIETLKEADLILAEDTRVTKKLLDYLSAHHSLPAKQLISYHHHSPEKRKLEILTRLIRGEDIALVTDAGTPGVSDPGNELIYFLISKEPDIEVIPIPGVSAVTAALSVSGMNVNRFVFAGFLPKSKLNKFIDQYFSLGLPVVYFDSPHRVIKNLHRIKDLIDSNCQVFVARELTKLHETHHRGSIDEVVDQISADDARGEVVVVVNPKIARE